MSWNQFPGSSSILVLISKINLLNGIELRGLCLLYIMFKMFPSTKANLKYFTAGYTLKCSTYVCIWFSTGIKLIKFQLPILYNTIDITNWTLEVSFSSTIHTIGFLSTGAVIKVSLKVITSSLWVHILEYVFALLLDTNSYGIFSSKIYQLGSLLRYFSD